MNDHVHDNACRTQDLYCPDAPKVGGSVVIRTNADRDFWNQGQLPPGPTTPRRWTLTDAGYVSSFPPPPSDLSTEITKVVENHRAVCTATAEQILDLVSQLYAVVGAGVANILEREKN